MKKLLTAALMLLATNLYAADMSYNNVSVAYNNVELDLGTSVDGDGFDVQGNFEIHESIYIPVRLQMIDYDFGIDGTLWLVGIGAHTEISASTDVYGELQFGNYELEAAGSVDDDALVLTAGIRSQLTNKIEGKAYFTSISFDDNFEDQTGIGGKLNFYLNKTTSFIVGLELLSDFDTASIGAQFDF